MSSAGRLIVACLAALAAALVMLGCGSGDETTSADIDPLIADDLIGQLEKIQTFLDDGNCDRASKAVDGLRNGINAVSESTGEEFTANAIELTDELAAQVEDQCMPAEKTTSSTTDSTDTLPTTTDTTDTTPTTTTTTKSTTTKSTTTTTTSTPEPTGPPGNPDNPNGNGPGGGVVPGRGKKDNSGHDKKPKPNKAGKAKDDEKERSR
jgi:methyl-accepting chemotaxis protein